MAEISRDIGQRIRAFRKARHLSLDALAEQLHKSKSTLSKYENGEIVIDIETLYEIAGVLCIHVEQLLASPQEFVPIMSEDRKPAFFSGLSRFYSYYYDGRFNRVMRCLFDVLSASDDCRYKIMMYMNYQDIRSYQDCETTYWGYMEHYDAMTNLILTNQDSPMEKANGHILATNMNTDLKWGLFNGISVRPLMPVSFKMLFSKKPLEEDDRLIGMLKITKDDIRIMKMYNMLTVM